MISTSLIAMHVIEPELAAQFKVNSTVRQVFDALAAVKGRTYFVGGCIRDFLLGIACKDYDIVTALTPPEIADCLTTNFPTCKILEVGKAFGITIINLNGHDIEIATMRKDGSYSDGRRPDSVEYTTDFRVDSRRRDFTFNALYGFFEDKHLFILDCHNGIEDLRNRVVRFIGDPADRITEDRLRMLRALRFAITLNGSIHEDSGIAIKNNIPFLGSVSKERISNEFIKILKSDNRAQVIDYFCHYGVWGFIGINPSDVHYTQWILAERYLERINRSLCSSPELLSLAVICKECVLPHKFPSSFLYELRLPSSDIDKICFAIINVGATHRDQTPLAVVNQARHNGFELLLFLLDLVDNVKEFERLNSLYIKLNDFITGKRKFTLTGQDLINQGHVPGPAFKRMLDKSREKELNDFLSQS